MIDEFDRGHRLGGERALDLLLPTKQHFRALGREYFVDGHAGMYRTKAAATHPVCPGSKVPPAGSFQAGEELLHFLRGAFRLGRFDGRLTECEAGVSVENDLAIGNAVENVAAGATIFGVEIARELANAERHFTRPGA